MTLQPSDQPIFMYIFDPAVSSQPGLDLSTHTILETPMTLDTLKNELKPLFTANVTKNPLLHADKNGKYPC